MSAYSLPYCMLLATDEDEKDAMDKQLLSTRTANLYRTVFRTGLVHLRCSNSSF
jgi:hypothetical protein